MGFDLHVHTTASDGKLTPGGVIRLAIKIGLDGLAITDHDTVDGIAPALEYISQSALDFELIPGIEFNTEAGQSDVHILGYYLDYTDGSLRQRLQKLKQSREGRAVKIVARLHALGLPVEYDRVKELAGGDVLGRPHIADAMIEKGYVYTREEAFNKYLDNDRPAYVPRYKFMPHEAIDMIHECGGLAVLAHPGLIREHNLVNRIIAMGIDGLEVYYPQHSEKQTAYYRELADNKGLLVTGGSDFHGSQLEPDKLGIVRIRRELVTSMKKRLNTG
jgi:predicted metal-dependent phosphoesterase TrpH